MRLSAAESRDIGAGLKQDAHPHLRQPRVGEGDRASGDVGGVAPLSGHDELRRLGDLYLGAQLVEAEPLRKLGHLVLRHLDQEPVAVRDDEEVKEDLALWGQQAGMDRSPVFGLIETIGDHSLQELVRLRARDA